MSLLRSLSAECWLTGNQIISLLIKMNALRIHFNLSPPLNKISEQNRLFYHTQVPCFVGDLQSEGLKTRSRLPGPGDTWLLYFRDFRSNRIHQRFVTAILLQNLLSTWRLKAERLHEPYQCGGSDHWVLRSPFSWNDTLCWKMAKLWAWINTQLLFLLLWYVLGRQDDLGQAKCVREHTRLHLTVWRVKLGNLIF